jgi:hypothetical protein
MAPGSVREFAKTQQIQSLAMQGSPNADRLHNSPEDIRKEQQHG